MSSVDSMRLEDFLCDFKITIGDKSFSTHCVVLAANSGCFKSLFSSNMKEVKEGCVTMNAIKLNVMQQCVEYMYTSSYNIDFDSAPQILEAANFLQILRLEAACFKFLEDNLSPENYLSILNLARTFRNREVEESAQLIIQSNLEAVMSSKLFLGISKQDLLRYISIASPQTSWKAITTWCYVNEKDFHELAEKVPFGEFSFGVLLTKILNHQLVASSDNIRSIIIQEIFADSSRLEFQLGTENCFILYNLATDRQSKNIIKSFMKRNFSMIMAEPEFCSLSKRNILSLLVSPEVDLEESKWDASLKWVKHDITLRGKHFADLFRCLNLDNFMLDYLKTTVRQEALVQQNAVCMGVIVDTLLNWPTSAETEAYVTDEVQPNAVSSGSISDTLLNWPTSTEAADTSSVTFVNESDNDCDLDSSSIHANIDGNSTDIEDEDSAKHIDHALALSIRC